MPLGEADTRAKLIDPAIHARRWTEDLIRREVTAGAVEGVEGQPRRRGKGRVDYTLRVRVNTSSQPVAGCGAHRGQGRASPAGPRSRAGQGLCSLPPTQPPVR